ncbi:MAG: aspartate kinase [Microscillaceae bacterium]
MKVYKFGGASLKDGPSVKNVVRILRKEPVHQALCLVVSAMGKTTNALEAVLNACWQKEDPEPFLLQIYEFHHKIIKELFPNPQEAFYAEWEALFESLHQMARPIPDGQNYDRWYDRLVSMGEIFSSRIVHSYFRREGLPCEWLDARQIIATDNRWREGTVQWEQTAAKVKSLVLPILQNQLGLTQGFIGADAEGNPTTLGREGSDYTAAILAHLLEAQSLTIWKDVPGVLNADPKRVPDAQLFAQLSYAEAAEMSHYGASVIHPKTIAPLAQKNIPLFVKSFLYPSQPGTCVDNTQVRKFLPCIMYKGRQMLIKIEVEAMQFLKEEELAVIFKIVGRLGLHTHLVHKTARAVSLCLDARPLRLEALRKMAGPEFSLTVSENLELLTIKNGTPALTQQLTQGREVLVECRQDKLYQAVLYSD